MKNSEFAHLYYRGMNPCTIDKSILPAAQKTWLCTGCNAPRQDVGRIDVVIQEDSPSGAPLTFLNGCGLILVRKDLAAALRSVCNFDGLIIGEVIGPNGRRIEEWNTIGVKSKIIIRGDRNVSYRRCEECGRNVYFAMGARYVFPAPPVGVSILETDFFGLLVPKESLARLEVSRWPDLGVESIGISKHAKDSLGELAWR